MKFSDLTAEVQKSVLATARAKLRIPDEKMRIIGKRMYEDVLLRWCESMEYTVGGSEIAIVSPSKQE